MNLPIDYTSSGGGHTVAKAMLNRIGALFREAVAAENKVKAAEVALANAVAEHKKITEDLLPELMKEAGLSELTLETGQTLVVEEDIRASITTGEKGGVDNRPAAHAWLRANGFASLIKNVISIKLGMEEDKKAEKLYLQLAKKYEDVERKESVHSSTLRSFVTEVLSGAKHDATGKPIQLPESITYVSLPVAHIKEPKRHGKTPK
jgi:hypothetical protein